MRKVIQALGLVIAAVGASGTIDHLLGHQPIMGFLNVLNRVVFPRVDALAGHELYANLIVVFLGVALLVTAGTSADRGR